VVEYSVCICTYILRTRLHSITKYLADEAVMDAVKEAMQKRKANKENEDAPEVDVD
jgi:hypothetical protein